MWVTESFSSFVFLVWQDVFGLLDFWASPFTHQLQHMTRCFRCFSSTFVDVKGHVAPHIDSVQAAGASLSTSTTLKSLGVVLDQRLTFHDHVTNVVKSCNYHTRAIRVRHIRHLLTQSAAQTLACSFISSRLDYCNSLLLGTLAISLNRLRRAQNIASKWAPSLL